MAAGQRPVDRLLPGEPVQHAACGTRPRRSRGTARSWTPASHNGTTRTDMGNGHWPYEGWQKCAFMSNLRYQSNRDGSMARYNPAACGSRIRSATGSKGTSTTPEVGARTSGGAAVERTVSVHEVSRPSRRDSLRSRSRLRVRADRRAGITRYNRHAAAERGHRAGRTPPVSRRLCSETSAGAVRFEGEANRPPA